MVQRVRFAVGAMLMLTSLYAISDSAILVRDAWLREAPPGVQVLAAYLTLDNPGAKERQLVAVFSPDFAKIEMHASEIRAGVARMIALDTLPIAPRSVVRLAPGGQHLMLLHPRRTLAAGDRVKLQLRFDSGMRLTVVAPVRRAEPGAEHHH